VVSADSSIRLPREVVVFAWGMRDHEHTAAARYAVGQELSLDLRRWSEARETLGDFSRRDFDDLSLLKLGAYFGEGIRPGRVHEVAAVDAEPDVGAEPLGEDIEGLLADRIRRSTNEVELDFLEALQGIVAIEAYPGPEEIAGSDAGWYMTRKSLDTLLSGTYWASAEEKWHSRLIERGALDAIVSYSEALRDRGIDLLLVPVPTKILLYPDRLLGTDAYSDLDETIRLDRKFFEFYRLLRERGVDVLDIYPDLARRVREVEEPIYREDDHHWSSYGDLEVAKLIGEQIEGYEGLEAIPKRDYAILEQTVIVEGVDRGIEVEGVDGVLFKPEHYLDVLAVREVGEDGSLSRYRPWRESPVLLIGDSFVYNLSWGNDGFGAGLRDHLSARLGFPIDSIGVGGGGANGARVELSIDEGRLDSKKVVIWCFKITNLVNATGEKGWKIVPLPGTLSE
jgi:hypothetical protein